MDEMAEASSSSVRNIFFEFTEPIVNLFENEYLCHPNKEDLKRVLPIIEGRELPGCLGIWDLQQWQWKNCPVAWDVQFNGKQKKPKIVLEEISDGELWIWGPILVNPEA